MTANELNWKSSGASSGDPKIFEKFEKVFEIYKKTSIENSFKNFKDLTNLFDCIEHELYIDSGHLNRMGNLIVSAYIADDIAKNDKMFQNA